MQSAFSINLCPEVDVVINQNNLRQEMANLSAYVFRYNVVKGELDSDLENAEYIYKCERARKYSLLKNSTSKKTEKQIEYDLLLDNDLKPIQENIFNLKDQIRSLDATLKALKVKEIMVVQLGADVRKERQ